jgi:GSH-dependent disulfide-bond oxidoreductase
MCSITAARRTQRWADAIGEWRAVKRGRMVNRLSGEPSSQLHERHEASDFDTKSLDKLAAAGSAQHKKHFTTC